MSDVVQKLAALRATRRSAENSAWSQTKCCGSSRSGLAELFADEEFSEAWDVDMNGRWDAMRAALPPGLDDRCVRIGSAGDAMKGTRQSNMSDRMLPWLMAALGCDDRRTARHMEASCRHPGPYTLLTTGHHNVAYPLADLLSHMAQGGHGGAPRGIQMTRAALEGWA